MIPLSSHQTDPSVRGPCCLWRLKRLCGSWDPWSRHSGAETSTFQILYIITDSKWHQPSKVSIMASLFFSKTELTFFMTSCILFGQVAEESLGQLEMFPTPYRALTTFLLHRLLTLHGDVQAPFAAKYFWGTFHLTSVASGVWGGGRKDEPLQLQHTSQYYPLLLTNFKCQHFADSKGARIWGEGVWIKDLVQQIHLFLILRKLVSYKILSFIQLELANVNNSPFMPGLLYANTKLNINIVSIIASYLGSLEAFFIFTVFFE